MALGPISSKKFSTNSKRMKLTLIKSSTASKRQRGAMSHLAILLLRLSRPAMSLNPHIFSSINSQIQRNGSLNRSFWPNIFKATRAQLVSYVKLLPLLITLMMRLFCSHHHQMWQEMRQQPAMCNSHPLSLQISSSSSFLPSGGTTKTHHLSSPSRARILLLNHEPIRQKSRKLNSIQSC